MVYLLHLVDLHRPLKILDAGAVAIGVLQCCIPVLLAHDLGLEASKCTLHVLKTGTLAVGIHEGHVPLLLSGLNVSVDVEVGIVKSGCNAVANVTGSSVQSHCPRLGLGGGDVGADRDVHHSDGRDGHGRKVPVGN
jgi:hypothetical protein